jgi:hypothetical protein
MNLINKKQRGMIVLISALHNSPHILNPTEHRRQLDKPASISTTHKLSQRSFPATGRPPQHKGGKSPNSAFHLTDKLWIELVYSGKFIQNTGSEPFSEWDDSIHFPSLLDPLQQG